MAKRIDPEKDQKLKVGYFEGYKLDQNAKKAGCSTGTAHSHIKKLEEEIKSQGLMGVLEKYGLSEVKEVAQLNAILKHNHAFATECLLALPVCKKLKAWGLSSDQTLTVIDQVFTQCPPEFTAQFGAAMAEFARERAGNRNLTIDQLRTEYSTLTANCRNLGERQGTLTVEVTRLESEKNQLHSEVDKLNAEDRNISDRLTGKRQTDQTLTQYLHDKARLNAVGVDISNLGRARQFFDEITLLNYSPGYVAAQLMNNPSLSAVTRFLGQQVSDLARKAGKKIVGIKEIQGLEAERQVAGRRAEEAEKAADRRLLNPRNG